MGTRLRSASNYVLTNRTEAKKNNFNSGLRIVSYPDPTPTRGRGSGVWGVYFERFLGLDDVAVLISGAPIRFTACDFSCDSAPAAQIRPQCLLHARPAYHVPDNTLP